MNFKTLFFWNYKHIDNIYVWFDFSVNNSYSVLGLFKVVFSAFWSLNYWTRSLGSFLFLAPILFFYVLYISFAIRCFPALPSRFNPLFYSLINICAHACVCVCVHVYVSVCVCLWQWGEAGYLNEATKRAKMRTRKHKEIGKNAVSQKHWGHTILCRCVGSCEYMLCLCVCVDVCLYMCICGRCFPLGALVARKEWGCE